MKKSTIIRILEIAGTLALIAGFLMLSVILSDSGNADSWVAGTGEPGRDGSLNLLYLALGITAFNLIIVIVAVKFLERAVAARKARDHRYVEHIRGLSQKILDSCRALAENDRKMEALYRSQWEMVNKLCYEFFEKGESERLRKSILSEIEKEIRSMRSPEFISMLEQHIDEYCGGFSSAFRSECGFLSESDRTFAVLVYAGFSPRTVCLLTDISLKYFYTKRSRIASKIMASEAKSKELFAAQLSRP